MMRNYILYFSLIIEFVTKVTDMKLLLKWLKWMRGRKMLKLTCNQVGSNKKFLLSTLPEDPKVEQSKSETEVKLQTEKPCLVKKVQERKQKRKRV